MPKRVQAERSEEKVTEGSIWGSSRATTGESRDLPMLPNGDLQNARSGSCVGSGVIPRSVPRSTDWADREARLGVLRLLAMECGANNEKEIASLIQAVSFVERESGDEDILLNDSAGWVETEFEVALDSGSVVHVCVPKKTLQYTTSWSLQAARKDSTFSWVMGDASRTKARRRSTFAM